MWIIFTICPGGHFCWRFLAAKPRFVLNVSRRGHNIQIIQGAAPKDGQCDESWIGKRFVAQLGSYCRLPMSQQSPNIRYFRSQISRWILWTFRWQYPLIFRWFCTVLGRTRCRGTQPLCPSVMTLCSTCHNRDHWHHHKDLLFRGEIDENVSNKVGLKTKPHKNGLNFDFNTQILLNFTKLCGLLQFLPQPSNIFIQIYLPYLWHFATLGNTS